MFGVFFLFTFISFVLLPPCFFFRTAACSLHIFFSIRPITLAFPFHHIDYLITLPFMSFLGLFMSGFLLKPSELSPFTYSRTIPPLVLFLTSPVCCGGCGGSLLGKRGRGIREGVRKRNMKDAAVGVRLPSRAYSREKRRKKRKEVPKKKRKRTQQPTDLSLPRSRSLVYAFKKHTRLTFLSCSLLLCSSNHLLSESPFASAVYNPIDAITNHPQNTFSVFREFSGRFFGIRVCGLEQFIIIIIVHLRAEGPLLRAFNGLVERKKLSTR